MFEMQKTDKTGKSFDHMLRDYARLSLVAGLGLPIKKPRPIFVTAEIDEEVALYVSILAEEAYKIGVPLVDVYYEDPRVQRAKFLFGPEETRLLTPGYMSRRAEEAVFQEAARFTIYSSAELHVYDDVDPKYPTAWRSKKHAAEDVWTKRLISGKQPWNVVVVPSANWAAELGMSTSELWTHLFSITGANQTDPIGYFQLVTKKLEKRRRQLDALQIKSLHFVGDETNLFIGLSPKARWMGGGRTAEDGTVFVPNWPTYEVYTTPDCYTVGGFVKTTKPFMVDGTVVSGLRLTFERGRIVEMSAESGLSAYQAKTAYDAGANQVGEVALVGLDSRVARSGMLFKHTLPDENAACHIATGRAYTMALAGGPEMQKAELAALGCNVSDTHEDMMISDQHTDVWANLWEGSRVQLIKQGYWTNDFQ